MGIPTATNQGLGTWIERRRVKSAGQAALSHHGRVVTYDVLAERIRRLANALLSDGVRPGDRIAYLGNNHPAFLETLFAAGMIGSVFVPLNTRLAPRELGYMLGDCGAVCLVSSLSLEERAGDSAGRFGQARRLVVDDRAGGAGHADVVMPEAARDYEAFLTAAPDDPVTVEVTLDDPALIIYTSGTTGVPKGAVLSHGNLLWNCLNVLVDYDVTSTERALMISPLFHVASLGMGCLPTLLKGGEVILEEKFEPGAALRLIEEHRATMISGVPTTFQMMCEHPDWGATDLSSLRTLTCGGSPVPMRVLEAYEKRGHAFTGGYGMTETSPGLTALQPRYSRSKAGSAGLTHFFSAMRVVDGSGHDVAPGRPGEVIAAGPNVITGYWNRPDAKESAFTDGWFRSGDIGYLDDDGFLYISDRLKDMIISGGENIYSAEVEAVIMQLGAVKAVAVIGLPDARWGEVPHAVLVLADGATLDPGALYRHLADNLARYKVPKSYQIVKELPHTSSGKIQKHVLRDALPDTEVIVLPASTDADVGQRSRSADSVWGSRHPGTGIGIDG